MLIILDKDPSQMVLSIFRKLRIMLQRKIGNYGLSAISMRVNKDKYKILLENIFLNRIFKKGKSLSNSVIQKHGEIGSSHISMKMRRKTFKLSSMLISQDKLQHLNFSKKMKVKFHSSLVILKLGNNG